MSRNQLQKEEDFRNFSLNGVMWKVILWVCFPLALYQSLNHLFKILDTMMAAHINAMAVSTVSYLSQINMTFSALGSGLAVGGGVKISEAYGAGNMELVKQRVSTLLAMCGVLGGVLLAVLIPSAVPFLRLMNTPEEFIREGNAYFILELFGLTIAFFNNVYMAIERARGNSARILYLNMAVILVKLGTTAVFVYIFHGDIAMIATATIISQGVLFAAGIFYLNCTESAFRFSFSGISWRRQAIEPMVVLSLPVMAEKISFSLGKVLVNSMSAMYGELTVGALGVSTNIGGITTTPQNGFQEGGAAVISQNLGGGKPERVLSAFWWMLVYNIGIGLVLTTASLLCLGPLSRGFARENQEFGKMIQGIYRYEALGTIPLGINAAVQGFLYGIGKTKITLFINFFRVFVFRIPVLWALQNFTSLGNESTGIVMAVSNIAVGALSMGAALYEIRDIRRKYGITGKTDG